MRAELLIDCRCVLGEGPLWHPERRELFWFDIAGHEMLAARADGSTLRRIAFPEIVSAGALLEGGDLLVASASSLLRVDPQSGARSVVSALEPDRQGNRSNDGRADRQGGFWIGTMSQRGSDEPGAGSIYRFSGTALTPIRRGLTIPNSICFSPSGDRAYCADTSTGRILTAHLDPETGLPVSEWEPFASVEDDAGHPDGAITDSEGCVWSARYGGGCVVRYSPDGRLVDRIDVPVSRVTCPAFGGEDMGTLFITTARENMGEADLRDEPDAGGVFVVRPGAIGLVEPRVAL